MKKSLLLASVLAVCVSCVTKEEKNPITTVDNGASFDSLLTQYNEDRLKLYPLDATYAGDERYNDRLPNDISQNYRDSLRAFYTEYKNALAQTDTTGFTGEQKISYKVLQWETNIHLEALRFKADILMPINQMWSLNVMMGQLAGGSSSQPFKTVQDYDNWLKRLHSYNQWLDTAMINMKKGIQTGYILPKAITLKVIPQFANLANGPLEQHLFYMPVNNMPDDFTVADKERLKKAFADEIQNEIMPRYKQMQAFLENEYLPAGRETAGISDIPNGEEYYKYLIKFYTTTDMTADEIFELGQSEVERITKEMLKVKNEVGFEGDLKSFFEYIRTKKELTPYTRPEQVLNHFRQIKATIEPNIPTLFDKTPKTPFEIRRTEAFREASASAEYNPGSVDGTRPGIFYVPIPNVKEYNILQDEDLFLHEAIPGHHYQVSLTQESKVLPEFRKTLYYSAYGEGWALYSESLGKQLGLYKDPYQYFGMLSAEMHRAIRLVVDAGMHTKGWSREQAIQYSLDHEAGTKSGITAEIERYMAVPGQALSYKIGQLKILELREVAKQQLGDDFDIRKFHDKVLESGCLPLAVLETKIRKWIREQKAKHESSEES